MHHPPDPHRGREPREDEARQVRDRSLTRELEGRAAVVTGSAQNLGRVIALTLAEAGASVAINARTSDEAARAVAREVRARGGKAIVHLADVSQPEGAAGLVEAAAQAFGRLDILVNNISNRVAKPIGETTFEDWREVQASTVDAAFLCIKAALPHLVRDKMGAIVNIGGVSGHGGVKNRSAVAAAKAGLAGLTGSLAVELAPQGVTINCIAPGHLERASDPGGMSAHFREKPIPVGRGGTAEEVAAMVCFLAGPNGRYISGETIHMNGAWYVSIA